LDYYFSIRNDLAYDTVVLGWFSRHPLLSIELGTLFQRITLNPLEQYVILGMPGGIVFVEIDEKLPDFFGGRVDFY
jgi:hypothetical protein